MSLSLPTILAESGRSAEAEAERRKVERGMLAAIVECSDDAIISKDLQGTVTSWNAGACRLFGYSAEEIVGRPISVLMPEERHDDMGAILSRIRRGERVEHFETVRVAKDGTHVFVSLSVSPILDDRGRIVGAAKIARDIGDRKRNDAERERLLSETQQAVQVRDIFISIAGHEFRTPLNALTLQLYNLRSALTDPAQGAAVERAQRQVERLGLLTNQLLDVAKMASGTFRLELAPMDLSDLAAEVVARMQTGASMAGVRIALQTPGPVAGNWDRSRLDQVLTNILANALKFGPGRPVAVAVESEDGLARVRVRDHGIGVAVQDRERIFQRFERGVSERSFGGLGLGLWIAQQIVTAHGGRIGVESPDGGGAEFAFEVGR